MGEEPPPASVDLFWLPLGAGGYVVRWSGRLYERWTAWREHRPSADPYHCRLMVCLDGTRYAVESAPGWNAGLVLAERQGER